MFFFFLSEIASDEPYQSLQEENRMQLDSFQLGLDLSTGRMVDLELDFQDSSGKTLELKELFFSGKPVLLSPVYFRCPTLCRYHLSGLFFSWQFLQETPGKDFQYIAFSIDPTERPDESYSQKKKYLDEFKNQLTETDFHFLTGEKGDIALLTRSLGYSFDWDEKTEQFIHPMALYVLSAKGEIIRVLQGISFRPFDIKMALWEAQDESTRTGEQNFFLYLYEFDPNANRYKLSFFPILILGGIGGVLFWGILMLVARRFGKKKND